MAATLAARVNSTTGSIDKFTSVYKTSGGGAKKLRGATTTRKPEDQWTRTGKLVQKTPSKGGTTYRNEVLRCKVSGCWTTREHRVNDDGTLCAMSSNLSKHYRDKHPKKHAAASMNTVVVVKPDGTNQRTLDLPFEKQQQHRFEVCDTLHLLRPASAHNAIKYELMLDLDFLGGYDDQVTSQCCH
jgi:hypothetical protein